MLIEIILNPIPVI